MKVAKSVDLDRLAEMSLEDVRSEWRRLYRMTPPKRLSRALLELGVGWKLQEAALGGHKRTVLRQLDQLASGLADGGEVTAPKVTILKPGARLVREWHGETHDVLVLDNGFEWRGETWPSLSAIATAITGARWSGPRFFGAGMARSV